MHMKDTIAINARKLFDKHGYHGAALRDICKMSACTMPTLYYYFENKETLFNRLVGDAFAELVPRLWAQLPAGVDAKEYAALMVIQKKHLTEDERLIYRLAMKTWLGFEDCGQCRQELLAWEQAAYEDSWNRYQGLVESKKWAKYISRAITAIIQRMILLGEELSDDDIREEIAMIFEVAMASKDKAGKE